MRNLNIFGKTLFILVEITLSIFLSVNIAAAADVVLDNGGPGTSSNGTWRVSGGVNPYGSNSLYASANGASYTFNLYLTTPGDYQVFAWWTEYSNRRTSVPYDITHKTGTSTVTVNQQQGGGSWQKLGGTWTFDNQATIRIRSLGYGTTSADAIKLVYVGNNTALPAFPVDLRGTIPEEKSITINASKPANAGDAIITLATYDADFPDEGELVINGNPPVSLFGGDGVSGNDQNSANISFRTPASYWRNGTNVLLFRHTRTQGYIIDAATVSFEATANTAPAINGSPATNVIVGNNYVFQPGASDADGDPLTFSISNRPSWAGFDSSTGRLSGTPGSAGTFSNIRISVSDGQATAALPAFSIIAAAPPAPQTGPAFPVDLRGATPEQASITVNTTKPTGATSAVITLGTFDADFANEGELVINGNAPIALFGPSGVSGNDQKSADIQLTTPASYWRNGDNTLLFRHTSTQGYIINAATVSFTGAGATTPTPQTGSILLNWTPPVARADGSALALSEISGYTVYYGGSAGSYPNALNINDGSATSATISNLPPGTYHMVVTTRDSAGRESSHSQEAVKVLN
jgi:hypothetical protein